MIYEIFINGSKDAVFRHSYTAHQFARWFSEIELTTVEVIYAGKSKRGTGIVGQYCKGNPTPEFIGRGDEHYAAGTMRDRQTLIDLKNGDA